MKLLLFLKINFYLIKTISSADYIFEAFSNATVTGETELPNDTNYRTITLDGMWKDSLGDIGLLKAFGKIESLSGKPVLEVIGVATNENGDKMWALYKRKSTDVNVGGGGFAKILAGTGKYKLFVGYECTFVARYVQGRNFHVQKCKIPKDILKKAQRFGN